MSSGELHHGITFAVIDVSGILWKKCRAENIAGSALYQLIRSRERIIGQLAKAR
jgi:hypothetical protein